MFIQLTPYLPELFYGVVITIFLTCASIVSGACLALIFTAILERRNIFSWILRLFILFICGTPLLVQIFLIYFGFGQFTVVQNSWLWILFREPMFCAILALSINTASYTTNLLVGAIASIPNNEVLASYALGMSQWQCFRRILLPRALRMIIPAYSNEIIIILKSTALVSTITILDLMGVTQDIIARTYNVVTLYIIAGVIYLCLNYLLLTFYHLLTRKYATT